jgi:RNA polymerase sigma-70 factor (ECF subfamily)
LYALIQLLPTISTSQKVYFFEAESSTGLPCFASLNLLINGSGVPHTLGGGSSVDVRLHRLHEQESQVWKREKYRMADSGIPGDFPTLTALKELGDGDLVRLLVRGHGEAMTVVFDRYYSVMMRVALRVLRNRAEAEDVVQVAFTDFYRQIQLFDDGKGSLRAWLLQYVYGRSINRLKTMKARRHFDHVELSDLPAFELAAPSERVFDLNGSEAKRLVQQILGTLNEKKRRIVELVCLSGMSIPEVAALTREPRTQVQHHYHRAIAKLRAAARETEEASISHPKVEPIAEKVARKSPNAMSVDAEEVEIG